MIARLTSVGGNLKYYSYVLNAYGPKQKLTGNHPGLNTGNSSSVSPATGNPLRGRTD